jgi:hypothetical protein
LEEELYIFSITDQLLANLPTTEFSFQTLDVLDLRRDQLVSLHLERGGPEAIELLRGPQRKWALKGHENQQNDGQIQLLLTTLTGLRAVAWVGNPKPEYGLDQPSLLIAISYQSGEQSREVEVKFGTANSENQHYGMTTGIEGVFLLNDEQFKQLNASLER